MRSPNAVVLILFCSFSLFSFSRRPFSRRFSSEKSPTITVASFLVDAFSIFFCFQGVAPSKIEFFLSPFIFSIFCNKLDFQKVRRMPPFTFLKTLRFLSLRYSTDFRRSCLGFLTHFHFCLDRNMLICPVVTQYGLDRNFKFELCNIPICDTVTMGIRYIDFDSYTTQTVG